MTRATDFWSRRKAQVQAEHAEELSQQQAAQQAEETAALEEKTDAELLAEFNLPDPDTLTADDDFSVFMQKAIPERLRQRALRKLWLTNPTLANVDGLVDYGEDFTDAANVVENLQTAYQVGKGMTAHIMEKLDQLSRDATGEDVVDPDAEDEAPKDDKPLPDVVPAEPVLMAETEPADAVILDEETPLPPRPRRMTFHYGE